MDSCLSTEPSFQPLVFLLEKKKLVLLYIVQSSDPSASASPEGLDYWHASLHPGESALVVQGALS